LRRFKLEKYAVSELPANVSENNSERIRWCFHSYNRRAMIFTNAAMTRLSVVCLACVISLLSAGCKTSHKSDTSNMKKIAVVPRANFHGPLAISSNASLLVYAPTGIIQSQRVYESIFYVQDVKSSSQIATMTLPVEAKTGFQFRNIDFCDHGRYLLAVGPAATIFPGQDPTSTAGDLITALSEDSIKVFDMKSYSLHADISLSAAEHYWPPEVVARYKHINSEWHAEKEGHHGVSFAACAANAPIAAIVIDYGNEMSTVKVFNLDTGAEVPGFGGIPLQTSVLGVAVSPQGSSLALFREAKYPDWKNFDSPDHCITIVDLPKMKIGRTIWVKSEIPLNANPIAYAGESSVAIELSSMEKDLRESSGPFSYRYRASVHVFDTDSGSELRVISDRDVDEFRLQGISADGRTMLAYAEKSHQCKSCNHGSGKTIIEDARFMLWNPQTGQRIAESPELTVVHHTCPWFSLRDWTWHGCISSDEAPELKLSQDGNATVASWASMGQPIEVYSVPTR